MPCVAHLLGVAALVLENGGDEDEAIAALLHDAVEDHGGLAMLRELRQRYGRHVADIVAGCSHSWEEPKPPWRERKEKHLARLRRAPPYQVTARRRIRPPRAGLPRSRGV